MGLRRRSRWYWIEPDNDAVVMFALGAWAVGLLAAIGSCAEGLWLQALWMVLGFALLGFVALVLGSL
jgi:ABC-type branched-subunit amino acid transport system permease subunit